jgi:hypothetical protein
MMNYLGSDAGKGLLWEVLRGKGGAPCTGRAFDEGKTGNFGTPAYTEQYHFAFAWGHRQALLLLLARPDSNVPVA